MRRKVLGVILMICTLLTFGSVSVIAEDLNFQTYSNITYNSSKITGRCFYQNNTTYIPLRMVSQMTGHSVTWNEQTNGITITNRKKTITCNPIDDKYVVDGKTVTLGASPILSDGTTYVPQKFIGDVLGLNWYTHNMSDIAIIEGDTVTITVTDTSDYYDEDDEDYGNKGQWVEGTVRTGSSQLPIEKLYVDKNTEFLGNVRFRNVKKGDVLEAKIDASQGTYNVTLKEVTVKKANDEGYLEFAGEITSKSTSSIKIKQSNGKTLTLSITSSTPVRAQGSSRVLKTSDLSTGLDIYGVYDYKNSTSGTAISIVVGEYDEDIKDAERGDTVTLPTSEVTSVGTNYIYVTVNGKSVRLDVDDNTVIRDARNSSNSTIALNKIIKGSRVYGTYEYQTSTKGMALKLYLTNEQAEGSYTSGSKVYFSKCKVISVSSSVCKAKIDGLEVELTINSSTKITGDKSSSRLTYKAIKKGDYISGSYKYSTAFKGTAYEIEIQDYKGTGNKYYDDDDYDYDDGDIVSFEGYIVEADGSDDYITVRINGKNIKLEIDEDTVAKKGSRTITNPEVSDFEDYEGYDVSGKYTYESSSRGYCTKIVIDDSYDDDDDDDYDDEDEDEMTGTVTKVGSSYFKIEYRGTEYKFYVDDDTTFRRNNSSRYDLEDLEVGDEVEVTYFRSSSKDIASYVYWY